MKSLSKFCSSSRHSKINFGLRVLLLTLLPCVLSASWAIAPAHGQNGFQVPDFKNANPFEKSSPFGQKNSAATAAEEPVTLSSSFSSNGDGTGELTVTAKVADGMHIFSVTQPLGVGAPKRTKIRIDDSDDVELTGDFQPSKDPHVKDVAGQDFKAEEHEGEIVFTAPLKFKTEVDPANVEIMVKYDGQACEDGEQGSCFPVGESISAFFAGQQDVVLAGKKFQISTLHVAVSGTMSRIEKDKAVDGPVKPGDKIRISILAEPLDSKVLTHDNSLSAKPSTASSTNNTNNQ